MGIKSSFRRAGALAVLALSSAASHAAVVYDTWSSNESPDGNYILTVTDTGATNQFNWHVTVDPWNAEALGLFVDLGSVSLGAVILTNVSPIGQVVVFATDTASDDCGNGCILNGLGLPPLGGGDWELVFRLAEQGFNGIQTFSWTTSDFGLTEADFGVVGIRAQQLCSTGTLPTGNCRESDKAFGSPGGGTVPEPNSGALALLAFGALGLTLRKTRKR